MMRRRWMVLFLAGLTVLAVLVPPQPRPAAIPIGPRAC